MLYNCRAHMTTADVITLDAEGNPRVAGAWTDQTKGKLMVHEQQLEFKATFQKPLTIPFGAISQCLLYKTKLAMIPFQVLWVIHTEGRHAFSVLRNKYWEGALPFPAVREEADVAYSPLAKQFAKAVVANMAGSALESLGGEIAGEIGSEFIAERLDRPAEQPPVMAQPVGPPPVMAQPVDPPPVMAQPVGPSPIIRFACEQCHAKIQCPPTAAGKCGRCPRCGVKVAIPVLGSRG